MDLRELSDSELQVRVEQVVDEERKATDLVIAHLLEVDRRSLFAKYGFSSLFDYCTQQLKYSASAAQCRIDAMRLVWMTSRQSERKGVWALRRPRELSTSYSRAG